MSSRTFSTVSLSLFIALVAMGCSASPASTATSASLQCVSDADVAAYPIGLRTLTHKDSEQGTNAGKSDRLKMKRFENRPLLRFDFAPIPQGATITSAVLQLHVPDDRPVNHVGISSLHVDWEEGDGVWNDVLKTKSRKSVWIASRGVATSA